ncbi:MAG: ABC transporter ATP-binding protein [Microlunatus sp.]|nr:ABC transporter ATP-binding protein [Microlunatus sp.]
MSQPGASLIDSRFGEQVAVVQDLTISYRAGDRNVVVAQDVSFTLNEGETVGLVGESGSGKSTVARTLLGHLRPGSKIDNGTVTVLGRDMFTLGERELRDMRGRQVAIVPQNAGQSLTPSMRVGGQIQESLKLHGLRHDPARIAEFADLVRLPTPEEIIQRYPHELSGGQQQRIAIAMAIATDPQVMVLDEPTTALDVITQGAVLALIQELRERLNMSILIVSHDLGVVSAIADNVIVLNKGVATERGAARDVLTAPRAAYTKRLLAAAPRLHPAPGEPEPEPIPFDDHAPTLLRCVGVDIRYPRAISLAVRNFQIDIREGETVAIVGESGSGKSTVAHAIAGLLGVEHGEAVITAADHRSQDLRQPVRKRPPVVRRSVQMIFQNADLALNPRRSIGDSVARPLRLFKRTRSRVETKQRVGTLLTEVGLTEQFARRVPGQLSGGQRQRIGIARALAAEPRLLIADEITTALDVSVQADVLRLLDELQERHGLSCLFISHDLAVVKSVAHRIVVMKEGYVVESGPAAAILDDPRHPYTRALLDSVVEPGVERLPSVDIEQRVRRVDASAAMVDVASGHLVRADVGADL